MSEAAEGKARSARRLAMAGRPTLGRRMRYWCKEAEA